jgi:tetratricopeptide (TPR) repeat protein
MQPGAQLALALVRHLWEWEWAGAETSFRRTLELAPSHALARNFYSHLLSELARHDEALEVARSTIELDPLSVLSLATAGTASFYARRFEEAIGHYRRAIELDPEVPFLHGDLARALECCGRTDEAVQGYERAIRLTGLSVLDPSSGLANVLAVAGRSEEAREMLASLERKRAERHVSPWALATIHARLGQTQEALGWLERAFEERDPSLLWLKVHPRMDVLRGEPRYTSLLERLKL